MRISLSMAISPLLARHLGFALSMDRTPAYGILSGPKHSPALQMLSSIKSMSVTRNSDDQISISWVRFWQLAIHSVALYPGWQHSAPSFPSPIPMQTWRIHLITSENRTRECTFHYQSQRLKSPLISNSQGVIQTPSTPEASEKIPVAILSTYKLDAPLIVDTTTITFGKTGDKRQA